MADSSNRASGDRTTEDENQAELEAEREGKPTDAAADQTDGSDALSAEEQTHAAEDASVSDEAPAPDGDAAAVEGQVEGQVEGDGESPAEEFQQEATFLEGLGEKPAEANGDQQATALSDGAELVTGDATRDADQNDNSSDSESPTSRRYHRSDPAPELSENPSIADQELRNRIASFDQVDVTDGGDDAGAGAPTPTVETSFDTSLDLPENSAPQSITLSASTVTEGVAGAVVGQVVASDANDDVQSLTVSDSRFEISGGSLKLRDGVALDYDTGAATISVTVTATDSHGASKTQSFDIAVQDVAEAVVLADGGVTFTDAGVTETSVTGGSGDDVITGTASADDLRGAAGGDTLNGGLGDDTLTGGLGDDTLDGGGGTGDVAVFSSNWNAYTITENAGTYTVVGADGTDSVTGVETFRFDDGDVAVGDVLNDAPTDISLSASAVTENDSGAVIGTLTTTDPDANDTVSYTVDDARFEVVSDQLKLKAGQSLDYETDGASVDVEVTATDAGGLTYAETFTLTLSDVAEALTLADSGVTFTDTGVTETSVTGGAGADTITGSANADTIAGGGNADVLSGAGGADSLTGDAGADRLAGGEGDDALTGGADADTFVYAEAAFGNDTISDYVDGVDQIEIHAVAGATSFGDLGIVQDGADTVVSFGAGTIRLTTTTSTDLDAGDFVFV